MPIELSTVVKQAKDQVSCRLDEEVAILDMKSSLYFGLEGVGAVIWQQLIEERVVADICKSITDEFEVDIEQCQIEITDFLDNLLKAGLIKTIDSRSADAVTLS